MGKLIDYPLPPGVSRPSTRRMAKGRWYDTSLVRWYEGNLQPVGPWQAFTGMDLSDTAGDPLRGMHAWLGNAAEDHLAAGSPDALYHFAAGADADISPPDLKAGLASATLATGLYGRGAYGAGLYGYGDSNLYFTIEANTWQFDNFGQVLLALSYADGRILKFDPTTDTVASKLENSPDNNKGVFVTEERFVVALGADGNERRIAWSDQEAMTVWAPTTENQAGGWNLSGKGKLMCGKRARRESLVWTDDALYGMVYIGGELGYSIKERGSSCGVISRLAATVVDGKAIWMGKRSFFTYDGYVAPLPSEVGEYVFSDLNRAQASKINVQVRAEFGEVTWHYPSSGSTECDRYVTFNYREDIWYIGELERTCGVDSEVYGYPLSADSNGVVYQHESGSTYLDIDGATPLVPFAESGPIELGDDVVMFVDRLVPDEETLGDVELSLISSMNPTEAETTNGPYTAAQPTDLRLSSRYVRVRLDQVSAGWRFGTLQLQVTPEGRR